jgi:hypothetical protein
VAQLGITLGEVKKVLGNPSKIVDLGSKQTLRLPGHEGCVQGWYRR